MTTASTNGPTPHLVPFPLRKPDCLFGSGGERGGTAQVIARAKLLDLSIWRDAPDLAGLGLDEPHSPVGSARDVQRIRVRRRHRVLFDRALVRNYGELVRHALGEPDRAICGD